MSETTSALLGQRPPRNAKQWREKLQKVTDLLVAEYGTPSLGNFRDPVKEIFYIVLSARTTEALYQRAFKQLWTQFPTLDAISRAPIGKLQKCVAPAGLGVKRAPQVKAIAARLLADFGVRPSRKLRAFTAHEAYEYLRTLPGVGPKSALCVMMYSLDFDVFPVDAHAQRVLSRLGAIESNAKH